jgi:hypothetical protein
MASRRAEKSACNSPDMAGEFSYPTDPISFLIVDSAKAKMLVNRLQLRGSETLATRNRLVTRDFAQSGSRLFEEKWKRGTQETSSLCRTCRT